MYGGFDLLVPAKKPFAPHRKERFAWPNAPDGEELGKTAVFAGYSLSPFSLDIIYG